MIVYARKYHCDGDITEIIESTDGRTGAWSPVKQQWVNVFGSGNNAGFRMALLDSENLTKIGRAYIRNLKKSAGLA